MGTVQRLQPRTSTFWLASLLHSMRLSTWSTRWHFQTPRLTWSNLLLRSVSWPLPVSPTQHLAQDNELCLDVLPTKSVHEGKAGTGCSSRHSKLLTRTRLFASCMKFVLFILF